MKKILIIFVGCLILASFIACDERTTTATEELELAASSRMVYISAEYCNGVQIRYYRDTYTDVVYVCTYEGHGYAGAGSFTPLVEADGTPLTYAEFMSAVVNTELN